MVVDVDEKVTVRKKEKEKVIIVRCQTQRLTLDRLTHLISLSPWLVPPTKGIPPSALAPNLLAPFFPPLFFLSTSPLRHTRISSHSFNLGTQKRSSMSSHSPMPVYPSSSSRLTPLSPCRLASLVTLASKIDWL